MLQITHNIDVEERSWRVTRPHRAKNPGSVDKMCFNTVDIVASRIHPMRIVMRASFRRLYSEEDEDS
tara:strand:- start:711 stop:911 length:201 start_codon:yes stop_codon:yes gene_type:complete